MLLREMVEEDALNERALICIIRRSFNGEIRENRSASTGQEGLAPPSSALDTDAPGLNYWPACL
jgi:hypothetical protein